MSEEIIKSHNRTVLLYHAVCPAKYRRRVFSEEVEKTLKEVCLEIGEKYEIRFVEIGLDEDHVHFLIQSVPTMMPKSIVQIIKSITAREIFKRHKEVKRIFPRKSGHNEELVLGDFFVLTYVDRRSFI